MPDVWNASPDAKSPNAAIHNAISPFVKQVLRVSQGFAEREERLRASHWTAMTLIDGRNRRLVHHGQAVILNVLVKNLVRTAGARSFTSTFRMTSCQE